MSGTSTTSTKAAGAPKEQPGAAKPAAKVDPAPAPPVKNAPGENRMANNANNANKGPKQISEKAVLDRAKRLARQQAAQLRATMIAALGLKIEAEDEAGFNAALEGFAKERAGGTDTNKAHALEVENQALKARAEKAEALAAKSEKERRREVMRRKDLQVTMEVKDAARNTGVQDLEYGLHLFREHVNASGEKAMAPKDFFEGLKKDPKKSRIFNEETVAAGGPSASQLAADAANAAPPADENKPGDASDTRAPPPAAPNKTPKPEDDDVRKMDRPSFAKRTAGKYGFNPGVGLG